MVGDKKERANIAFFGKGLNFQNRPVGCFFGAVLLWRNVLSPLIRPRRQSKASRDVAASPLMRRTERGQRDCLMFSRADDFVIASMLCFRSN